MDRACFSAAERRATSEANWGAKARNSLKNYCKKEEAASKGEVLLRRGGLNYLYTPAPGLGPHSLTESLTRVRPLPGRLSFFPGHIVHPLVVCSRSIARLTLGK